MDVLCGVSGFPSDGRLKLEDDVGETRSGHYHRRCLRMAPETRTRETGAYCFVGICSLATLQGGYVVASDPSGRPLERCVWL